MVITSVVSFYINKAFSQIKYSNKDDIDFEQPLTNLVWITSILSIGVTFLVSYLIIGPTSSAVPEVSRSFGMFLLLLLAAVL